ncbi:MAG: hypothetical protein H7834_05605 [Magnetococcus sp. YQC-9]
MNTPIPIILDDQSVSPDGSTESEHRFHMLTGLLNRKIVPGGRPGDAERLLDVVFSSDAHEAQG